MLTATRGNENSTQGTAENDAQEQQSEGALDEETAESVESTGIESESSETDTAAKAAGAYGAGEWRTYDEEITLTFGDPYDTRCHGQCQHLLIILRIRCKQRILGIDSHFLPIIADPGRGCGEGFCHTGPGRKRQG